jgi:hypothetical protein
MYDYETSQKVKAKEKELAEKYPIDNSYSSKCGLWSAGLVEGIVDKDLFNSARKYYGDIWYYTGD